MWVGSVAASKAQNDPPNCSKLAVTAQKDTPIGQCILWFYFWFLCSNTGFWWPVQCCCSLGITWTMLNHSSPTLITIVVFSIQRFGYLKHLVGSTTILVQTPLWRLFMGQGITMVYIRSGQTASFIVKPNSNLTWPIHVYSNRPITYSSESNRTITYSSESNHIHSPKDQLNWTLKFLTKLALINLKRTVPEPNSANSWSFEPNFGTQTKFIRLTKAQELLL